MPPPTSRALPRPAADRRERAGDAESAVAESFSVAVAQSGPEATVAPRGDLDLVTAEVLAREVRRLQARGPDRIVLDLRGVRFLDSTGLRVLLSLRNDAKRNDHRLVLVPGPRAVQRVFALTATRGLFDWRA